jgi:hypothetical protein
VAGSDEARGDCVPRRLRGQDALLEIGAAALDDETASSSLVTGGCGCAAL